MTYRDLWWQMTNPAVVAAGDTAVRRSCGCIADPVVFGHDHRGARDG